VLLFRIIIPKIELYVVDGSKILPFVNAALSIFENVRVFVHADRTF